MLLTYTIGSLHALQGRLRGWPQIWMGGAKTNSDVGSAVPRNEDDADYFLLNYKILKCMGLHETERQGLE